jgi:ABC-type sugar transport system ATPase subunit
MYGMEPVTRGTILLGGRPYRPRNPTHAMTSGVAFLTEERKVDGFIPLMSAYKNVVLSTLDRYRRAGFVNHQSCQESARATLARIGTRGRLEGPIKALSGGNQQKVLLARIIEQGADLILLDEPTKGVDVGARADIYALIRKLAQEGRCVVVVSSEEEELIGLSDRIAIFHHGRCEQLPVPVQELSLGRLRQDAWAPVKPTIASSAAAPRSSTSAPG